MTALETLPGIGSGLAAELRAVGVRDAEMLRALGAANAAERLAELKLRDNAAARRLLEEVLGKPAGTTAAPDRPIQVLGVDNVLFSVGDLDVALEHYAGAIGLPVAFRITDPPIALLRLGDETPGLLLREDRTLPEIPPWAGSARVWLEVPDATVAAERLRTAGLTPLADPFPIATGRTVEVADRWSNVVGLTDYSATPDRGRVGGEHPEQSADRLSQDHLTSQE